MALGFGQGFGITSPRTGGWTPAQWFLASEQGAWYDPSDMSTLFQDAAGTTPVTAAGQPVGKMLDKSGRGNHASQANASNKPVLQQSGGLYYLQFDGVDDFLVTGNIDFTGTDKMTVVAGVRSNLNSYSNILELGPDSGSENGFSLQRGFAAAGDYAGIMYGTSQGYAYTSNFAAPDTSVITAQYDIAEPSILAGELAFRRNGVVAALANASGNAGTGNFTSKPLYIGRRAGTTFPFNGHLYQLVVRGALTADLAPIESFTADKAGVTL